MASITIRNLDDAVRTRLRVRAAEHSRSMEEEVRIILRDAVERHEVRTAGSGGIYPRVLCAPWRCRAGNSATRSDARTSGFLLSRTNVRS